jgi:hypothetical protein
MRAAVLVATTLAVSLVSGTAAAAARVTVEFSRAPLGPKSAFHDMVSMRHSGSAPIVLAARARRVARIDWNGERVLLVAPIKGGGFCASLSGPYGGSSCRQRRVGLDPGLVGDASGPIALNGEVTEPRATRLELRYDDGSKATVHIIWVGAPINAGFFVFPIARLHRLPGHRPLSLSTYARDGRLLSRTNLH